MTNLFGSLNKSQYFFLIKQKFQDQKFQEEIKKFLERNLNIFRKNTTKSGRNPKICSKKSKNFRKKSDFFGSVLEQTLWTPLPPQNNSAFEELSTKVRLLSKTSRRACFKRAFEESAFEELSTKVRLLSESFQ